MFNSCYDRCRLLRLLFILDASIEPAHINLGPEDHLLVSDRLSFPRLLRVLKVNHRVRTVNRATSPSKIATGKFSSVSYWESAVSTKRPQEMF